MKRYTIADFERTQKIPSDQIYMTEDRMSYIAIPIDDSMPQEVLEKAEDALMQVLFFECHAGEDFNPSDYQLELTLVVPFSSQRFQENLLLAAIYDKDGTAYRHSMILQG